MYQISLFEYLMVSVAVILSWRVFQAGHPPPAASAEPPAATKTDGVRSEAAAPAADEAARLAETLQRLAEGSDDVTGLLEGAKQAYESIVQAYAGGDLAEHRHLLADPIRQAFEATIAERRAHGASSSLTFIGFETAEIVAAGVDGTQGWMDVHFIADVVASTSDRDGKVIAGYPARVTQTDELWTFERDLTAAPDWRLTATGAAG